MGGAHGDDLQAAMLLSGCLTGRVPCSCVAGDSAVWPPAQCAAETVSAALSILQPPASHQSALPLPDLSLLQQLPEQGDPAAGDELCAARYIHSGKPYSHIYRCNLNNQ